MVNILELLFCRGRNSMEKIFEKIGSYNLLNNMLPGSVFVYLLKGFVGIDILQKDVVNNLFLFYFIGMIISRIGSLVVEPICKKVKFVVYANYGAFLEACKTDLKIDALSEINNTYRTFFAGILTILGIWGYKKIGEYIPLLMNILPFVVVIFLLCLFAFSYRKQTSYIRSRVEKQMKTGK